MRNVPSHVPASEEPTTAMRAGAPDLTAPESEFEAQQDQEAQAAAAAAAAAQRREDQRAATAAELKNPSPETGVSSSIAARVARATQGSERDGDIDADQPAHPAARGDCLDGRRAVRTVETQADERAGDW